LSEEVDLLPSLLLPLAGPEHFGEQEMERFPVDLQFLPDDKQREPDPDIRRMLIEALMKVCITTSVDMKCTLISATMTMMSSYLCHNDSDVIVHS